MKSFVIAALSLLCLFLLFRRPGHTEQAEVVDTPDTVTIERVDTLHLTRVVYRDRWQVRVDTLRVPIEGDTVVVPVPIHRHLFTDDSTYRAQISGFNVSLDSMEVYRRTLERTVTIERLIRPKPKRWGLGIQAGCGINTAGRLGPYIGVGVSFNIARW